MQQGNAGNQPATREMVERAFRRQTVIVGCMIAFWTALLLVGISLIV
jgi:hypothetical protein